MFSHHVAEAVIIRMALLTFLPETGTTRITTITSNQVLNSILFRIAHTFPMTLISLPEIPKKLRTLFSRLVLSGSIRKATSS